MSFDINRLKIVHRRTLKRFEKEILRHIVLVLCFLDQEDREDSLISFPPTLHGILFDEREVLVRPLDESDFQEVQVLIERKRGNSKRPLKMVEAELLADRAFARIRAFFKDVVPLYLLESLEIVDSPLLPTLERLLIAYKERRRDPENAPKAVVQRKKRKRGNTLPALETESK